MAAAAFGGRVMLSSLLAEIVDPYLPGWLVGWLELIFVRRMGITYLPGPQRRLYRYQTYAEGRVMACRERCSLWQVYLHVFVMVIPKIEFSLCVVFFSLRLLLSSIPICMTKPSHLLIWS